MVRIVLIIVIIAAVIGGGTYLFQKQNKPTVTSSVGINQTLAPAQVSITKDGFVPASIVIKQGQQVTWTNLDVAPHWVASDPHPTHTGLPGLDSQGQMQTKESFTFTFEKTGKFTYHDHLNPYKVKGSVVVQ